IQARTLTPSGGPRRGVEMLVGAMQDPEMGVNMFDQRLLLTVIPHATRRTDILQNNSSNLTNRMDFPCTEALNLSNLLVRTGYVYPLLEPANFSLQPDDSIYRFQVGSVITAVLKESIYLAKKNVMKNGDLADYEKARYQHLHAKINHKWDFIIMQAKEQMSAVKERRRGDRLVLACQEQAFWLIQRPPVRLCSKHRAPSTPPCTHCVLYTAVHHYLFVRHCDLYTSHDPIMSGCLPSNPWISQDPSLWSLHATMVEVPAKQRVECWAFSFRVLLNDQRGRQELREFLLKEFSGWSDCQTFRRAAPRSALCREFLSPGAKHWINLDGRTMAMTVAGMKQPCRFVFEEAQGHIYLLMKKVSLYWNATHL
uniref:Regulator of G protein signaling 11 n=1 Tax=Eptatretus burgeri TaxID=7764 RepID=A0A8C4R560_EPTBU